MHAAVIVFPGSNCDRDVAVALRQSIGQAPLMHWHADADLPGVDLIVLPGGFSYGDYLRCGSMAAASPVMRTVIERANAGVPVMGICNGFQMLTETGLLPGVLMRNANLKFICRDVRLRVDNASSRFTSLYAQGQIITVPIAHHDGNYFADRLTLDALEGEGRIAFRYVDEAGAATRTANPNGSQRNIAGILNEAGNVMGMMPHPERLADAALGGEHGRTVFDGLVARVA